MKNIVLYNKTLTDMKTLLLQFLTIIATFITPIAGVLLTLIVFIGLDTLTAIYVSVKQHGWKSFRSNKLFNIVIKTFFYLSTVMLGYLVDVFIIATPIFGIPYLLAKSMAVIWIYTEIKSLDENQEKLTGKSLWTVLKEMIGKAKKFKKDLNELKKDE